MRLPLDGVSVLILRPATRAEPLIEELEALGARVTSVPAIDLQPIKNPAIDSMIQRSNDYSWIVFTSVTGVEVVATRAEEIGRRFRPQRVAAVGPATKNALSAIGIDEAWVPEAFTTKALAETLPTAVEAGPAKQRRLAAVRAASADTEMDLILAGRGFEVERIDAYQTIATGGPAITAALKSGVEAVVLTSASIARSFAKAAGAEPGPVIVSIGPATTAECRELGIPVQLEAAEHTASGIVGAIAEYFSLPATRVAREPRERA